jgi:hypothetical protein
MRCDKLNFTIFETDASASAHQQKWTDPTTVDKFCPHDEACSKASGLTPPR